MVKKTGRILLWVLSILLFCIGSAFVMLQIDSVQTWLAQRAAAYFSDQLKTKVTIGKVSIRFFEKVSLKNLYVEDLHHQTLLNADELLVNIKDLSTSRHQLEISLVKLSHAQFFLTRYHGEDRDNISFLSDYFGSKDTVSSSSPWKIKLNDIRLEDVTFRHVVEDETISTGGVDFSHLDVKNIFGDLKNISFVNDSVFVNIHALRFRDHSGFQLDELSADAKVSPVEMRLNQLRIRTPQTNLFTDLTFRYDSMSAFDNFINAVRFNSSFKNSTVSFDDIAFFSSGLKGLNRSVNLDGNFKGTVSRFKGKNITIKFGEHSHFKGNIAMTGLPEIEETYMDILATDVMTNKKDVESIPLPPFSQHGHVVVPENLAALGAIDFKGKFTGFLSDFVAFGNVNTDIGFISSDLNLKLDAKLKKQVYSGHFSTNHFDIGKIISAANLGKLTMNADVKGSGFKLDNLDAKLVGSIDAIEFRSYNYRGLKINGELSKKLFNGALVIHEPNIDLDFSGKVNFNQSIPEFDFIADIGKAHLDTLNLFKYRGEEELKTRIVSHFKGNKLDNLEGTIQLENTDFRFDRIMYHINDLQLSASNLNGIRSFDVKSDNADASFSGKFELSSLGDAFKQIVPKYLPAVSLPVKGAVSEQDFVFNIRLKNMSVITENFLPAWWIEPNTVISGKFNSITSSFLLNVSSPLIKYKNFRFFNAKLNGTTDVEKMKMTISSDELYYSDSSSISNAILRSEASGNNVSFVLKMADSIAYPDRASIKGGISFHSADKFDLIFNESDLILQHEKWGISSGNKIEFDSSSIQVTGLSFAKDSEEINLFGTISKNEKDVFSIGFKHFGLRNLNPLLKSSKISLGGTLNGDAKISDAYRKLNLTSNLNIDNLQFNDDTLGNAAFITSYDDDRKLVSVNASVMNGAVKIIGVEGNYHTDRETDNLDFDVTLNNFYLDAISEYVSDVVSELKGRVSAGLKLSGSFSQPAFEGKVNLNRVRCKVNYLNTRYNFTNEIKIEKNQFVLKDFIIYDEKSEPASVNGTISHNFFKDFNFDVKLEAKKFQCLNTSSSQNSIYYGIAYASGSANFSGPIDEMNMQIQFTSEKGSQIFIPLSSASEITQSSFISFRERGKIPIGNSLVNKINLSGIRLDMSLDITPDAEIQIIFDEKIGDKIIGNGNGNLRLDINPIGDFNMYGTFEIMSGSYMFTLQNIINKMFTIQRGSTISWGGNPYDADINLSAIYTTTTSTLYKLLPDSIYRTSLKVDCELDLTNKLMNPTIKYSINVRGVDANAQNQISSLLNSEAEVSKQMFGLLVLNQFIPGENAAQNSGRIDAGAGAGATGYEFLNDQFNNWLSQVSSDINIGFNYRAKDLYSKEEYKLMFSKSLANDRLLIEGNVGYIGTSSTDQSPSSLVGDFNAEYKLSPDGRLRIKAYNKSNASNLIYNYAPYTQGFGIFYREEFNTFRELLQRYKLLRKKEEVKSPSSMN